MEDIVGFTERIMDVVKNDEDVAKKARKTKATVTISLKNGEDIAFSIKIDSGNLTFSREEIPEAEFKIEMTKQNYEDLLDGKISGMKMLKVITIVKGSLMGMKKLSPIFENLPKVAQELKSTEIEVVA